MRVFKNKSLQALTLLLALLCATASYAGVALTPISDATTNAITVFELVFTWTAAGNGTVTAIPTTTAIDNNLAGWYVSYAAINSGATVPTTGYSMTLSDANGDIFDGNLAAIASASNQRRYPKNISALVTGPLTLAVTGNSVGSATGTVTFYLQKAPIANKPDVSASVSIDTSALASSAKQDTAQTALNAIKTDVDKLPSQGPAAAAASMPVVLNTYANLVTGQQDVTASAVALANNTAQYVCVNSMISSTVPVYVGVAGVTTTSGFELTPGAGNCWYTNNTSNLYVRAATTGGRISWSDNY